MVEVFFSRTDLGVPRTAGIVNLPELISNEKDPILLTTLQIPPGVPRNDRSGGTHRDVKVEDCRGLFISSLDTLCMNDGTNSMSCDLSKRTGSSGKAC